MPKNWVTRFILFLKLDVGESPACSAVAKSLSWNNNTLQRSTYIAADMAETTETADMADDEL